MRAAIVRRSAMRAAFSVNSLATAGRERATAVLFVSTTARTSRSRMRPPRPLPLTSRQSIPNSSAMRRARGEILGRTVADPSSRSEPCRRESSTREPKLGEPGSCCGGSIGEISGCEGLWNLRLRTTRAGDIRPGDIRPGRSWTGRFRSWNFRVGSSRRWSFGRSCSWARNLGTGLVGAGRFWLRDFWFGLRNRRLSRLWFLRLACGKRIRLVGSH